MNEELRYLIGDMRDAVRLIGAVEVRELGELLGASLERDFGSGVDTLTDITGTRNISPGE